MKHLGLALALVALAAHAEDETYRDPNTKETLFIAGGPNVSYASIKRSSLRPLKIVEHDDNAHVIKVKFDKSPTIWTLTIDPKHERVVCEAPGEPRQVFERVKIGAAGHHRVTGHVHQADQPRGGREHLRAGGRLRR